jgi:hypothetical protein
MLSDFHHFYFELTGIFDLPNQTPRCIADNCEYVIYQMHYNVNTGNQYKGMCSLRKNIPSYYNALGTSRIVVCDPVSFVNKQRNQGVSIELGIFPGDVDAAQRYHRNKNNPQNDDLKRKRDVIVTNDSRCDSLDDAYPDFDQFLTDIDDGCIDRKKLRRNHPEICAKYPLFVTNCLLDTVREEDVPDELLKDNTNSNVKSTTQKLSQSQTSTTSKYSQTKVASRGRNLFKES